MATVLPPVEKLPLAIRKNLRDEFEAHVPEWEKELSDLLGTAWKIDMDPKAVYAYATDGYAKESLGSCMGAYVKGALWRLKGFEDKFGAEGVKEINTVAHAHKLTLGLDEKKKFSYSGVDVHDGALRILFAEKNMGSNIDYALDDANLLGALNEAPVPAGGPQTLSVISRTYIQADYQPKIEAIRKRVGELIAKDDIKFNPNFEDTYEKLKAESKVKKTDLRDDWERALGNITLAYFEGLISQLQWQKFEDDDLLQEGFQEAVSKNEIVFRIVDKLKYASYCEVVVEDGYLYIQSTAKTWNSNCTNAAEKLVDQLD